jgi:hypothetical protein
MAEWLPSFINKIAYDSYAQSPGTSRVCHDPTIMTVDSLGLSAVHHFMAARTISQCRPVCAMGGKKTVVDLSATSKI